MTGDGDGNTYSYDAEGRIAGVGGNAGSVQYIYGASGRRAGKVVNGAVTGFVYDLSNRDVAEFDGSGNLMRSEVFANGLHLATYYNNTTYFDHADWLGTERARSPYAGGTAPSSLAEDMRSDPWGDAADYSGGDLSDLHFTGKMRDAETGLDYFGARYNASGWGRFMTPDFGPTKTPVPFANYENPLSLNLYVIAADDPVSTVDTDGHSFLVFNAKQHTIELYSHDGTPLGRWAAYNNVDSKQRLRGGLRNGTYAFADTTAPRRHPGERRNGVLVDSENGSFGPYGIFRLKSFVDDTGEHEGVGIHAGDLDSPDKAGRKGPQHATDGCVRSTDAMMKETAEVAKDDPLTTLTVEGAAASLPPQYLQPPAPPSPVGPGTGLFALPPEMVSAMSEACQQGNSAACL